MGFLNGKYGGRKTIVALEPFATPLEISKAQSLGNEPWNLQGSMLHSQTPHNNHLFSRAIRHPGPL
jgi:hypothetical protein